MEKNKAGQITTIKGKSQSLAGVLVMGEKIKIPLAYDRKNLKNGQIGNSSNSKEPATYAEFFSLTGKKMYPQVCRMVISWVKSPLSRGILEKNTRI